MKCPVWQSFINDQKQQAYFIQLQTKLEQEALQGVTIYPSQEDIFNAFELTHFDKVKVVILGQDPYHGKGQAHGLAFSVLPGTKIPPSLANIYKELATDITGFTVPNHGHLRSWAEQGVLLLNTVLTVQESKAHAHAKFGWETFTDNVIEALNVGRENVVFLLWGSHAINKGKHIVRDKHLVLTSVHPSPLSAYRGFFGCQHFSKTNAYLTKHQLSEINWQLKAEVTDEQLVLI